MEYLNQSGSMSSDFRWETAKAVICFGLSVLSPMSVAAREIPTRTIVRDHGLYGYTSTQTLLQADSQKSEVSDLTAPRSPSWYFEIAERIESLSHKQDGWKGEDSLGMLDGVRKNALHFLNKLESEKIDRRPSVGLDYEGTLTFVWLDDDFQAELTVFEDSTYCFFAKKDGRVSAKDAARISDTLDGQLLSLLLA